MAPSNVTAVTNQGLIDETIIVDVALIVTIQPTKTATALATAAR
jgi:hypothetical protein